MAQFSYPTTVLSNGIHHLNSPMCMVKNKIITQWVCCCLGLGLCLNPKLKLSDYHGGCSKAMVVFSVGLQYVFCVLILVL